MTDPEEITKSVNHPYIAVSSIDELSNLLCNGERCLLIWKQDDCQFKTSPARVLAVKNRDVLVSHWTETWVRFDDPAFDIYRAL